MSRTNAHAPMPVRLARGELAARPWHAPGCGAACDLPTRTQSEPRTSCYWTFAFTGIYVCSCAMCHGGPSNRADRRRDRHRARAELRQMAGGPNRQGVS